MDNFKINIDKLKINILQSRDNGIPVIFLPGLGFSSEIFIPLFESPLGLKYRLISIDLPGNGNSEYSNSPAEDYSLPGLINIIKKVTARLFAENAVFIGHSLSGYILIEGYEDFPWARGFCLINCPPLTVKEELTNIYNIDKKFYNFLEEPVEDDQINLLVSKLTDDDNREIVVDLIKKSDYKCRKYYSSWLLTGEYINEKEALRYFSVPIALIAGQNDSLINIQYIKGIKSDILWQNKAIIIPDAKHLPMLDNKPIFIKTLEQLLFDFCGA